MQLWEQRTNEQNSWALNSKYKRPDPSRHKGGIPTTWFTFSGFAVIQRPKADKGGGEGNLMPAPASISINPAVFSKIQAKFNQIG